MHIPELDKLLINLNVAVEAIAVCEIAKGIALAFEPLDEVVVHHIIHGSGVLEVQDCEPIVFAPGSLLLIPARRSKRIATVHHQVVTLPAKDHCSIGPNGLMRVDGSGARCPDVSIVCGALRTTSASLALFNNLPSPIVEDMSDIAAVRIAFDAMLTEQARPGVGSVALIASLMKQCLLLLVRRRFAAREACPLSLLLQDERLSKAVAAILAHPGETLSMKDLAASAGMSRSAFAKRFVEAAHITPMDFVRRTRLKRAADLLSSTDLPIKTIAAKAGYASRSQFCRAFGRAYHMHPSEYRKCNAPLLVRRASARKTATGTRGATHSPIASVDDSSAAN